MFFYFWRPGSALQKSVSGLLRSLLYQLAKAKPEISDLITATKPALNWTERSLLGALQNSLTALQGDRVFLMVDGLDEYEGQYAALLDTILELQNRSCVKICLASRPEIAISAKLEAFPRLQLEDLNHSDISRFVWDKLRQHEDVLTEDLIYALIFRAEGVFLWAALVVESMISGCLEDHDAATLWSRLENTPTELFDLFEHLLSRVDKAHQDSVSLYFFHLDAKHWYQSSRFARSVSLITASLPIGRGIQSSDELVSACTKTTDRIVAQCKGLVEIENQARSFRRLFETTNAFRAVDDLYVHSSVFAAGHQTHEHAEGNPHCTKVCFNKKISLAHRSTYDFLFGPESSGTQSRRPWFVRGLDTHSMARTTLDGLVIRIGNHPFTTISGPPVSSVQVIFDCAMDAITVGRSSGLDQTGYLGQWLDGLRANILPSLPHTEAADYPVGSHALFCNRLSAFWQAAAMNPGYVESRWNDLMREPGTLVICSAIVRDFCDLGCHSPLCSRLLEHLQKTREQSAVTSAVRRRFIEAGDENSSRLVSWDSFSTSKDEDDNEACVLRNLNKASIGAPNPTVYEASALLYEWRVYSNIHLGNEGDMNALQLQFSDRTQTPTSVGSESSTALYRIVCFRKSTKVPRRQPQPFWGFGKPSDCPLEGGLFDLGTESTKRLRGCYAAYPGRKLLDPRFTGSRADFDDCLNLVVKEIEADEGGVLTPEQQLYMLEYVKEAFKEYWNIDSEGCGPSCGLKAWDVDMENALNRSFDDFFD